jgi:hypothetical protein
VSSPLIEGRRRPAIGGLWLGLGLSLVLWTMLALAGVGVYALVSGRVP